MILATLAINGSSWWIVAVLATFFLVPLAWRSWANQARRAKGASLSRLLRILALALLAIALLDPQWTRERPSKGENIIALIVDNSAGLQIFDTDSQHSRGEVVKRVLIESNASWLADLREDFQIRFYQFDDNLRRVRDLSGLDFKGERSNLRNALKELNTRFRNQPLAAVIAITDGIVSDLDPQKDSVSDFPVFTVSVGNDKPISDARIGELNLKQTAFDDTPVKLNSALEVSNFPPSSPISASITRIDTGRGFINSTAEDTLPNEQSISIQSASDSRSLEFEWRPNDSGIQFYKIGLETPEGSLDRTPQNDQRLFMVDRGKKSFRILYVTGRPNWDFKFLNRALAPDPQLEMSALIRVAKREPRFEFKGRAGESSNPLYRGFGREEEDIERYDQPVVIRLNTRDEEELRGGFPSSAEELFGYDAIIIDDLEADFFNYNQLSLIRSFVSQRGGGLLLLGGAEALESGAYENTPLAAALPVYLDKGSLPERGDQLKWKLTREGWVEPWSRIHPNQTLEEKRIESMPPFRVLNTLPHIKPGARTLAVVEDEFGNAFPGVVAQNYGAGKTACIAVGDLWRWAMQGPKGASELSKHWRQIARWLVTDAPQPVEAKIDRNDDGSIHISIFARDEEFRPLDLGSSKIRIRRLAIPELGSTTFSETTLNAFAVSDKSGQFGAKFYGNDEGAYIARITVTDQSGKIVGETETGWVEEPTWTEFQSLVPNKALLTQLSEKTGGEAISLNEVDSLPKRIAANPAPIMESYASPIWHNSWIFLIILACLLAEWAIRRKQGLA